MCWAAITSQLSMRVSGRVPGVSSWRYLSESDRLVMSIMGPCLQARRTHLTVRTCLSSAIIFVNRGGRWTRISERGCARRSLASGTMEEWRVEEGQRVVPTVKQGRHGRANASAPVLSSCSLSPYLSRTRLADSLDTKTPRTSRPDHRTKLSTRTPARIIKHIALVIDLEAHAQMRRGSKSVSLRLFDRLATAWRMGAQEPSGEEDSETHRPTELCVSHIEMVRAPRTLFSNLLPPTTVVYTSLFSERPIPNSVFAMATIEGFKPHLYVLRDISTQRSSTNAQIHSLCVVMNGPTAIVTFILPTSEHMLAVAPPTQFEDWVQAILGRELQNCEASDQQRHIVLQLALLYQAFFYNIDEPVAVDLFRLFVEQLLLEVLSLDDHEPAEPALTRVMNWAHDIMPPDLFWDLPRVEPVPAAAGVTSSSDASESDTERLRVTPTVTPPVPIDGPLGEGTSRSGGAAADTITLVPGQATAATSSELNDGAPSTGITQNEAGHGPVQADGATAPPRAPTAAAIAEALALLLGVSLHTDAAAPTSTPLPDLEDGLVAVPPALEVDEPLEGYDSDDGSMPELRTPTGSSDDEYDHI
ncbi:hypothetical protein C8Q76DRAFT_697925 [Earliella scabrosa]|nr:hypothetical protein C8Q76DRAFT_697925 [Earliella scabrosa]